MVRLQNIYQAVRNCHRYRNVRRGSIVVPHAYKCSDIVSAIRRYVQEHNILHPTLSQTQLIDAIGKDLIAMQLIQVVIPGSRK